MTWPDVGLRVLIVEDEPLIAMSLLDAVADLGHEVVGSVSTVDAALESLRQLRPAVVLLDINLSGQMSYEVANHCTVEGIPVVLTTGYQATEVPGGLRHCPVLSKPFDDAALQWAIEQATSVKHPDPLKS